ncbi:MAG: hypothetical protein HY650_13565 [Acidobacteria bacterium]|nr:hypothetical protein [Acidobacteriota bacterium]
MALPDILAAMEAEVDTEARHITERAASKVNEIRAAAESEAHAIREQQRNARWIPLQQERSRRLNRARLSVLRITNRAREQFFNQALELAGARLAQLRDSPGYGEILPALAHEALAHMEGETVLHADPRDKAWLLALEPQRPVEFDLRTWGGLEARTLDGRIVVVNTLEARLECAREMLRQEIIPLVDQPVEQWANTTMPTQGCVR